MRGPMTPEQRDVYARARAFIERHVDARQNQAVVHGFPPVLFWADDQVSVERVLAERPPSTAEAPRGVGLYVGTPFCPKTDPVKCGYCLFPVVDYTGNTALEQYLELVETEAKLYRGRFDDHVLRAVFFGGGTGNLYRADKYPALMDMVRSVFPKVAPDADLTLEGLPALFTREKIQRIREAGFNRVSMGAQQMNDELNALSGRQQTARHVIQAVEWARA